VLPGCQSLGKSLPDSGAFALASVAPAEVVAKAKARPEPHPAPGTAPTVRHRPSSSIGHISLALGTGAWSSGDTVTSERNALIRWYSQSPLVNERSVIFMLPPVDERRQAGAPPDAHCYARRLRRSCWLGCPSFTTVACTYHPCTGSLGPGGSFPVRRKVKLPLAHHRS
jgi:hypothetical protein